MIESDDSDNDNDDFENTLKELLNMNKITNSHIKETFDSKIFPHIFLNVKNKRKKSKMI